MPMSVQQGRRLHGDHRNFHLHHLCQKVSGLCIWCAAMYETSLDRGSCHQLQVHPPAAPINLRKHLDCALHQVKQMQGLASCDCHHQPQTHSAPLHKHLWLSAWLTENCLHAIGQANTSPQEHGLPPSAASTHPPARAVISLAE